ncbi:hemolysin family protein [Dietzia cinnamea]|uniref:hemolysin family protein n=1 Tax=Dietzia cinnamea TaxID=321318 RepID=UPI0021A88F5F|nr:hemolysin family protein [Dietzia cinnamea]MCT1710589.1 hemolysin family protein [Dietzia cinnamea]
MTVALLLTLALVLLIAANALFVGVEFGFLTVNRDDVRAAGSEGDRVAAALDSSLSRTSTNLSGAQLGITVTSLVAGYLTGPSVGELLTGALGLSGMPETAARGIAMTAAFVVVTFLQMVFGELVPKNWAIAAPMQVARLVVHPQRAFMSVFGWLVTALNASANQVLRLLGFTPTEEPGEARSPEELRASAARSGREGVMDPHTAELVTRSISFGEHRAADAMVPRPLVTFLRDHTAQDLLDTVAATGRSRFPVLGGTVDEVVGVVHYRQALAVDPDARDRIPVRDIAAEPTVVSEMMTLDPLMRLLRQTDLQMAVVVDEFGGTAGIVTLEDLVEEIVGEIDDEQDRASRTHERIDDDTVLVGGMMRPDELGAILRLEIPPAGAASTLSGVLTESADRLPEVGDEVELEAHDHENRDRDDLPTRARVRLRVETVSDYRAERVRATVLRGEPDDSGDAGAEESDD